MLNYYTIICSHLINGLLIAYWLSADAFFITVKIAIFPDYEFHDFQKFLCISSAVVFILTALLVTDAEDAEGLFGKGETLTKGMVLKKTGLGYTFLQISFLVTLVVALYASNNASETASYWLIGQLVFNLIVPILILLFVTED